MDNQEKKQKEEKIIINYLIICQEVQKKDLSLMRN